MNHAELKQVGMMVQSFFAINNQTAITTYKLFWQTLGGNPDAVNYFLTVLLSKLIGMSTGEDKTVPLFDLVVKVVENNTASLNAAEYLKVAQANDLDADHAQSKQSVLLTLYFVMLFLPFEEVTPVLKAALNRWIEAYSIEKGNGRSSEFADEILRMLNPAYLESNDFLLNLVEQCSVIEVPPVDWAGPVPIVGSTGAGTASGGAGGSQAAGGTGGASTAASTAGAGNSTSSNSNAELTDAKIIARSLLNSFLTKCLLNPSKEKKHKAIIDTILLFLKHPLLPETRMLTLLHMLKRFVTVSPTIVPSTLTQAMNLVKNYYLWPRPYGDFAREVLHSLTMESKSPGSVMRNIIFQENPALAPKWMTTSASTGRERVAYVIADLQYVEARTLHDLLKMIPDNATGTVQMQLDILGNMLQRILGCDPETLGLEFCSPENIQIFYEQGLEILEKAITMNEKDARNYRHNQFTNLRELVGKAMQNSTDLEPPQVPRPPPLLLQVVGMKCTNARPKKADEFIDNNLKFVARKQCLQTLTNILTSYTKLGTPKGQKHIVKLGVIGSDSTIHHLTSAHVCLRREQPHIFNSVELRYYFIPTSGPSSMFATFLGRNDRWYCRNVMQGLRPFFNIVPVLAPPSTSSQDSSSSSSSSSSSPATASLGNQSPSVSSTGSKSGGTIGRNNKAMMVEPTNMGVNHQELLSSIQSMQAKRQSSTSFFRTSDGYEPLSGATEGMPKKSASVNLPSATVAAAVASGGRSTSYTDREGPQSPGGVLKQEIDNFFREATWKLRMKLFQCECWSVVGDELLYFTIPFCLRAELGITAYARAFAETNELPSSLTLAEMQQHKSFKYTPASISIKYVQMNVMGVARPAQTLEHRPYQTIVISNVGQSTDRMVSNPTRPWLEVYTNDNDPKKKKGRDEPQGHFYHTSLIELETDNRQKQADVILDGELYGPFHRVRISACTIPDDPNEILDLPIMTYLPLDLV